MINLDALQKAAESTDYDLPMKTEAVLKLIKIARAAQRAQFGIMDLLNRTPVRDIDETLCELASALEGDIKRSGWQKMKQRIAPHWNYSNQKNQKHQRRLKPASTASIGRLNTK